VFKELSMVFFLVIALATVTSAQKWEFDKAHSNIGFSVKHMVISNVHGNFADYSGFVNFDGKNLKNGSAEITIQVASITTDNERRDNHLKSGDFFEVDKFPTIAFKSKKIMPGEGNKFKMVGDLTIKDVTKEVTLNCEFNGVVTGMSGDTRAGFSAQTTINRQDFNVAWDNKLKDGSLIVANEVKINLEIELVKMDSQN
jgi:polyisoprenoid-binding protein YceI